MSSASTSASLKDIKTEKKENVSSSNHSTNKSKERYNPYKECFYILKKDPVYQQANEKEKRAMEEKKFFLMKRKVFYMKQLIKIASLLFFVFLPIIYFVSYAIITYILEKFFKKGVNGKIKDYHKLSGETEPDQIKKLQDAFWEDGKGFEKVGNIFRIFLSLVLICAIYLFPTYFPMEEEEIKEQQSKNLKEEETKKLPQGHSGPSLRTMFNIVLFTFVGLLFY